MEGRQHKQGTHITSNETIENETHQPESNLNVVSEINQSIAHHLRVAFCSNHFLLNQQQANITPEHREDFYNKNIKLNEDEAVKLCILTLSQNTAEWLFERKKRITASKCYELYTYDSNKNPNWNGKIRKLISTTSLKIPNLVYGTETEGEAREWYKKSEEKIVDQLGFVVHPSAPFLGCSPDGCCFEENKLIEIKCPVEGDKKRLLSVLPNLKYLSYLEGVGYTLKEKHTYYGQIQPSMLILNLTECDFIVYGKFSEFGYIINVKFNERFAKKLYETLHKIYFNYYLPVLLNEDMCNDNDL